MIIDDINQQLNILFWFNVSAKCHITIDDAKIFIPELAKKFINQKINIEDISPQLKESVIAYISITKIENSCLTQ